jgi:hypothetical protein
VAHPVTHENGKQAGWAPAARRRSGIAEGRHPKSRPAVGAYLFSEQPFMRFGAPNDA